MTEFMAVCNVFNFFIYKKQMNHTCKLYDYTKIQGNVGWYESKSHELQ